jgi:cell division protein FtsW
LFGVVVWRGFVIGATADALGARFKAYLCYGLSSWLGLQAMINMAVNMGALPTKGLTLPFISYGGSSLITVCVMLGLLLRVDHENRMVTAGHPGQRNLPRGPAGGIPSRAPSGPGWSGRGAAQSQGSTFEPRALIERLRNLIPGRRS